jgi:hypothetical protein
MAALKFRRRHETMPMPWAARMNGLANRATPTSRASKAIDQAFLSVTVPGHRLMFRTQLGPRMAFRTQPGQRMVFRAHTRTGMGTMRVLACLLLASAVLAGGAHAQDYYFGVTYDTNLALQDTKDFAGDFSWIGMSLEGRKMFRPDASVGFVFGWHEMDKSSRALIVGAGNRYLFRAKRYVNSFPISPHSTSASRASCAAPGARHRRLLVERRVEVGGLCNSTRFLAL